VLKLLGIGVLLLPVASTPGDFARPETVTLRRVPEGGIQPQVAVDRMGNLHMVYYKGDPGHGDLYYVRSRDGGVSFSAPLRVNSIVDSAIGDRQHSWCEHRRRWQRPGSRGMERLAHTHARAGLRQGADAVYAAQ